MTVDILAALEATAAPAGGVRCKVGRWLDTIPTDAPGRDALIETFETTYKLSPAWRSIDQLDQIAARLGQPMSNKTIGVHRMKRCRCYL